MERIDYSKTGLELIDYLKTGLFHTIHTSERRSFRSCRRRWDWAYRLMYYPRVTPQPLEFGVAFHTAMEIFYDPETWQQPIEVRQGLALVKFKSVCEEQLASFRRLNGEPETTVIDDYKARIVLGLNMIRHYTEHVSVVTDVGFTPVAVEHPFEVPVTDPDTGEALWCKCERCWKRWRASQAGVKHHDELQVKLNDRLDNYREEHWKGLPVSYGGRCDMIAQDELGRLWIYDWKTTARILDEDAQSSFLALDDQIASYVWALRLVGLPIAGFVYVEIKKDYPQVPEQLSRLYKGRKFSTSKTFLTTPDIYRRHVAEHDPVAYAEGAYDEHIAWLKRDGVKFHQRHQIHKNDHEVDEIARNIFLEAQDIVGEPRVYPQPGRFSCTSCLYRQACIGKNQGEDYLYTLDSTFERRTKHYYEEKEPSTE